MAAEGLEIVRLEGAAIGEAHWDAFWAFYQDTGARKWGQPYLTRAFFSLLGERMAERLLLVLALRDGAPIAGALNLIGEEALYGRYWGAIADVPYLHFELCYYQAIEAAIERGLSRVEAGAQGAAQIGAGLPAGADLVGALSSPSRGCREAVADYLARERPRGGARDRGAGRDGAVSEGLRRRGGRRPCRRARRGPGAGLRRSRGRSSPRRCRRGLPAPARCRSKPRG